MRNTKTVPTAALAYKNKLLREHHPLLADILFLHGYQFYRFHKQSVFLRYNIRLRMSSIYKYYTLR